MAPESTTEPASVERPLLRASFSSPKLGIQFTNEITFYVNGTKKTIANPPVDGTLADYIRSADGLDLSGTKIGCNEGGCGACSVAIALYDPVQGHVVYKAVNSCIVPLISIDGKHLITVEGLGSIKSGLHPVQERLAKFHGSQCGYCTPGIIMSVYALLRNNPFPRMEDLMESLSGNLCRCTGYSPIIHSLITFASDYDPEKHSLTELSKTLSRAPKEPVCAKGDQCCRAKNGASTKQRECQSDGNEIDMNQKFGVFSPNGLELKPYDPKKELEFPKELRFYQPKPIFFGTDSKIWLRPTSKDQLFRILAFYRALNHYKVKIVGGSSEFQVENYINPLNPFQVLVYVNDIPELTQRWSYDLVLGLRVPGNFALSNLEVVCESLAHREKLSNAPKQLEGSGNGHTSNSDHLGFSGHAQVFECIADQLKLFAGRQIRNVASAAGNLVTASPIADLNPCLVGAGARIECEVPQFVGPDLKVSSHTISLDDFFVGYRKTRLPENAVVTLIVIPPTTYPSGPDFREGLEYEYVRAYKQSKRREDDISIVSACFRMRFERCDESSAEATETALRSAFRISECTLCFGGMAPCTTTAPKTQALLVGRVLRSAKDFEGVLEDASSQLMEEFALPYGVPGGAAAYRRCLALLFFFRFFHYCVDGLSHAAPEWSALVSASASAQHRIVDVATQARVTRQIAKGHRDLRQPFKENVVGGSDVHLSALKQVTGEAIYTDDMPVQHRETHCVLVRATQAHARIRSIDWSAATAHEGVLGIMDIRDIASKDQNTWGIFPFGREEFFADGVVRFYGQTIGAIIGESRQRCQEAARKVQIEYEPLEAILTIEDAIEKQSFFPDERVTEKGDWDKAFSEAAYVFEDTTRIGSQEQFYFETQNCLVVPEEDGELKIYALTQNPTETQEYASHITGIPSNKIVCRVKRLGGGFGGKETRSVPYTSIAALAAIKFGRPVRLALTRMEDMLTTGQRHPFLMKWRVALDKDYRFTALDATLYANAGFSMDLTRGVIDRAVFHAGNCYNFPNARIKGVPCYTNTILNTAFRTFGGVQGCFLAESMLYHICENIPGLSPERLREINYLKQDDTTTYKQLVGPDFLVDACAESLKTSYEALRKETDLFNQQNRWIKRGVAQTPVMFGVSFGVKFLNQAGALVHIYKDGSVLVSHGGTEMGQGLHTKMAMIAAEELHVPLDKVFILETSTQVVANTLATAASASSDLNGMAVKNACEKIKRRLDDVRQKIGSDKSFEEVVMAAYLDRVNLSANGFYKTPDIDYEWGNPNPGPAFFYYTQGVANLLVEVDTLTGDWACLQTDIKMDIGRPINQAVDYGQIEGAFVQGMGLMTFENSLWLKKTGALATTGPGSYKIPGFGDVPQKFNVSMLTDRDFSHLKTIKYSKGIGEPPLILGMSVYFAIRDALASARRDNGFDGSKGLPFISPLTSERIRMAVGDALAEKAKVEKKDGEEPFFVEA